MKVGNSARQRRGNPGRFLATVRALLRVMPVTLALLLSQLPLVPVARAQETSRSQLSEAQKQKTKEHYEKATRLYNVGKYQEAIAEYEAAYLVSADPVMLFNIAQCHRLNNQPDEAVRFYKNYLRNAPGAPNRDDVERKIVEMERLSEERRRANVPTTQPPTPTPVTPAPGPAVSPAGPPPLGTGSPPPGSSPGEPVSGVSQTMPKRHNRVLPYTLLISGGALLATSVVFAAVAGSKAKQVEDRAKAPGAIFDTGAKKLQDDGKAASGVAVVTGLAGLAAGGIGLYFLLRLPSSSETGEASPLAAETATRAPGTSVFPVVGDGAWGAGARFSF
jgi:tetratricopeptide (TPR) repeat protein